MTHKYTENIAVAMYKVSPDVKPRTQPLSSCCWLTCFEMLFEWKKKDTTTILSKMDESPDLYPYLMKDIGIAPNECRETARRLGLKCAGDGEIAADILLDVLKVHGPIWVAGNWGSGSHVIVVTACDAEDGRIRYVNPYANNDLTDSPGTVSWLTKRGNIWKNCDASVMYF